jgi:peroxiredoxin
MRWSRLLLSVALPCLLAATLHSAAPATGQAAPDFNLSGRQGTLRLSQFRGQVVLLDFWASWCAPCAQSFPWLESLQQKYHGQGFTVLGVNVDKDRRKAEAFLGKHRVSFPVAFDPKGVAAAAYALPGMPSSYLVDRTGGLRVCHTGFRQEEAAGLEKALRELLAEPAPAKEGQ